MTKFQKFIKKKGLQIAMLTTVAGLIGIPILFWFTSVITIGIGTLFILLFISGTLGLWQWEFVKKYINMTYNNFAMYAFVGFGVCLVNFILLLNYSIRIKSYSETYTISKHGYNNHIIYPANRDYRAVKRNLTPYFNEHVNTLSSAKTITVKFDTGLFGMDMIDDCTFN